MLKWCLFWSFYLSIEANQTAVCHFSVFFPNSQQIFFTKFFSNWKTCHLNNSAILFLKKLNQIIQNSKSIWVINRRHRNFCSIYTQSQTLWKENRLTSVLKAEISFSSPKTEWAYFPDYLGNLQKWIKKNYTKL